MYDAATGMNYMQQRFYHPEDGRFVSGDPVPVDASSGANFNRYWYPNNNPYRFTDPDGRESVGEIIDRRADGCNGATCAGWAAATALWTVLGAEGVSQMYDKGWDSAPGDKASAGLEVLSVVPIVKAVRGTGLVGNVLFKSALSSFKGTSLTNAGRALTKHPEVVGLTKDSLRLSYRTDVQLNKAAAEALKKIMRAGERTVSSHGRYGDIVTYQIPGGFGARFEQATNRFIGFINP